MVVALLLHIYQPPTQFPEVLKAISEKSYVRMIELLKKYPEARLTLNIPAALTEQWKEHGYNRLITDLRELIRGGQVELTGSAAYHGLLFKLPEAEIIRQIRLNGEINRRFFGDLWSPRGFFPPEMAVNERALKVIETCGYEWVVLEEIQSSKFKVQSENRRAFLRKGGKLKILFRDRGLSLRVAFGKIKTVEQLIKCQPAFRRGRMPDAKCQILALDGETFGWHRPEQLGLLEEIFKVGWSPRQGKPLGFRNLNPKGWGIGADGEAVGPVELVTITELVRQLPAGPEIGVGKSSWGKRVERGSQVFYPRWEDPGNVIHQLQWQLTNLAIETVRNSKHNVGADLGVCPPRTVLVRGPYIGSPQRATPTKPQKQWLKARHLLDRALHSDQYFWAEGKNVWHPGMIERGARMLKDVVSTVPDSSSKDRKHAKELYDRIVETGRNLYGEVVKV